MAQVSEFDLIRDYFRWDQPPDSVRVGVGDDAAILRVPPGSELVVSVDTCVKLLQEAELESWI